jgi:uncharacterized protein (DUF1684 family)
MSHSARFPSSAAAAALLLISTLGFSSCRAADAPGPDTFQAELDAWKAGRSERLHSPTGWLTLIGLDWLQEGDNLVGSAPDAVVKLPADRAPARAAHLALAGGKVTFTAEPQVAFTVDGKPAVGPVELRSDEHAGEPSLVALGSVSFYIISRNDRLAVRVKDSQSPKLTGFTGIESFPADPSWRVNARFEPYPPGKTLQVPTILGTVDTMAEPGAVVFERDGKTYRLDTVLEEGETDLFIIFGDLTNRHETYGGGRFLYAKPADANGRVMLDFNRAYNPPCVFTPYATCPLPPAGNKLSVRVEAGEKMYGKQHDS